MIEHVFRSARVRRRLQRSLLGLMVFDEVAAYLVGRRHSATTAQQYIQSIEHFDRWLRRTRRPVAEVGEEVVAAFLSKHLRRCRCPVPACTTLFQVRAALRHLLVVLRRRGSIAPRRAATVATTKLIEEVLGALARDSRGRGKHLLVLLSVRARVP